MRKVKELMTAKAVKEFFKKNGLFMAKMGALGAIALLAASDPTFAQQPGEGDGGITLISGPIQKVEELMSGSVAKALVTLGIVMAGGSYALNIDNQAVKSFMRIGGGGTVALGSVAFINQVTGILL